MAISWRSATPASSSPDRRRRLGVTHRFAQFQGCVEQGRYIEHDLILSQLQARDPGGGYQGGWHMELVPLLRRGPGADPCIAEGPVEGTPAYLRGAGERRVAPLRLRQRRRRIGR